MAAVNPVKIVDQDVTNRALAINEDGSIGTRVTDGAESLAINPDGSINTVGSATQAALTKIAAENLDAAFRQRVSQVITLGDYKVPYDPQPLLWDSAGTGSVTHSPADAWYDLSVTAGQYAILQTTQFHPYASGKSQFAEWTFVDLAPVVGVVKRCGYFSTSVVAPYTADRDGIFLETTETEVKFVVERDGVVTYEMAQAGWDDPLDGSGASGKTVNWSNFIPVFIDFLWLGGTRVRLWAIIDGEAYIVHTYAHSNNEPFTMIHSPSQPIRYEVRSTSGTASLKAVCSQVSTEGALSSVGLIRSFNMGVIPCNANAVGTRYATVGIKLKDTHRGAAVDVVGLSIFTSTNTDFVWELWLNPDVAGTFNYNPVSDAMEAAQGDTANVVTNGYLISSGYGADRTNLAQVVESAKRLGSKIDGTMDRLVLSINPLGTNADAYASLTWRELT